MLKGNSEQLTTNIALDYESVMCVNFKIGKKFNDFNFVITEMSCYSHLRKNQERLFCKDNRRGMDKLIKNFKNDIYVFVQNKCSFRT